MVLRQVRKATYRAPSPQKLDNALPVRQTHLPQTGTAEGIYRGLEPRKMTSFNRAEQYFRYSDIVAVALDNKIITSTTVATVPTSPNMQRTGTRTCLPSTLPPSFRGTKLQWSRLAWSKSAVGDLPSLLQRYFCNCVRVGATFAISLWLNWHVFIRNSKSSPR